MNRAVIAVAGVLIGAVGAILIEDGVREVSSPVYSYGEWIRIVVTAISVVATAYLAIRTQNDKGYKETILIQKDNLQALDIQNKRFKDMIIDKDKEIIELNRKVDVLTVKTDLSQVMEMITENSKAGEERYNEAISIMTRMIGTIEAQNRENADTLKKIIDLIDKRWKVS